MLLVLVAQTGIPSQRGREVRGVRDTPSAIRRWKTRKGHQTGRAVCGNQRRQRCPSMPSLRSGNDAWVAPLWILVLRLHRVSNLQGDAKGIATTRRATGGVSIYGSPIARMSFPHLGDAGTPLSLDTGTRSGRVGRSRCVRRL